MIDWGELLSILPITSLQPYLLEYFPGTDLSSGVLVERVTLTFRVLEVDVDGSRPPA